LVLFSWFVAAVPPALAAPHELEAEMQRSLRAARAAAGRIRAGEPAGAELARLKALAENIRAADLLLDERLKARAGQLAALDAAARRRQREMAARYRAAVTHFLTLVDGLVEPPDPAVLQNLLTLLDRLLPEQRFPLLGTLPYRRLNLPPATPVSAPTVTPAYLGGDQAVTPADTEAPASAEIAALAASLGWSPVAIYEWVLNNVGSEWYRGSMKGAAETLRQRSGNDADQAALLTALLRAAGFPARYVRGAVEFFPDLTQAKSLTGLDDPSRIAALLQRAGIPFEPVIAGGAIANFRIEHVWVETFVPYANYRGAVLDDHGKRWVPLDTHLKPAGCAWSAGAELPAGFSLGQLRDDYLATPRPETPLEYLRGRLEASLSPGVAYSDLLRRRTPVPQALGILPGSLPFATIAVTGEYAQLPADLKHTVTFRAAADDGRELFSLTLDVARLASRQMLLSFEPETVEDQRTINAYGGLDNTPAYLVHLRPALLLDGERLAVARDGLPMGAEYTLTVTLAFPGGAEQSVGRHVAGNLFAVAVVSQRASLPAEIPLEEKDAGRLLFEEALRYIDRWNQAEEELAALLKLGLVRPVPTVVTVGGVLDVTWLLDAPHGVTWKGLFLDAGLRRVETVAGVGQGAREADFLRLAALQGSALEHRIFEDDLGIPSVSTARLLALAQEQSAALVTLDAGNLDTLLPGLPFAENVKDDIRNAVHQGLTVTAAPAEVSFRDWTGIGYRKENPATGEAGYMLSGMIAGGQTADAASKWVDQLLAATLSAPYSGKPNGQPLAAASVRRITAVDRQGGTVGATLAEPLSVLVQDKDGIPVRGAAVTFRVLAGGGSFGEADSVTAVTDYQGIARAPFTLGRRTADSPIFRKLGSADPFFSRFGLNLVTATVMSAYGELAIDAPFEAYGAPGAPVQIVHRLDADGSAIPPEEIFGLPNTPVGTLLAQAVDQYGNPVSNVPVTFAALPPQPYGATAPLPEGARNVEFYRDADCADPYPLYGECATLPSASVVTAYYGAPIEAAFGNTVGTRYTVTASAAGLAPLTFTLKTTGYRTAGAYVAPGLYSRHLDLVGPSGEPVNAAPAGAELPAPLVDELFVLAEQFTMSGPYACSKTSVQGESYQSTCWDMLPSGVIEATPVVNGEMTYTVTAGAGSIVATQNNHDGSYAATYRTGEEPAVNIIEARGRAVVTLPRVLFNLQNGLAVTQGYETAQLPLVEVALESGQSVRFDWRNGEPSATGGSASLCPVYGVGATVSLDASPVLRLAEGGVAPEAVRFNYVIEPPEYAAVKADLDLLQRPQSQPQQNPTFRATLSAPARQGFGQAVLAAGASFPLDQSHFARLVLNRGTAVEIKSDLLPLPTLVADLDIDSDNNAGAQPDGTPNAPQRDPWEDQVEDQQGRPGKVLRPNLLDVDGDAVPGFADGIDLHDNEGEGASTPFTPLLLSLGGSALDPAQATVRLLYPGSDPAQVQKTTDADGKVNYAAAPGSLRIWTKDGKTSRKVAWLENGGDYIRPEQGYKLSQLGAKQPDGSWKLYLEGLAAPEATNTQRIALAIDPDGPGPLPELDGDAVRATVLLASLIPDYNHNREIDEEDRQRAARGDTYYFWINDDDDEGETEGSDIPGEKLSLLGSLDAKNNRVDGVRDLIDFFPVVLDIAALLEVFPPDQYAYRLKAAGENLNVLFAGLDQTTAGNYLTDVDTARNIATVKTYPVPANGVFAGYGQNSPAEAQQKFNAHLQGMKEQGAAAVILLEGSAAGKEPLTLAVADAAGAEVFATRLNLSLDGVEQMFRHVNLIAAAGGPEAETSTTIGEHKAEGGEQARSGPPANYPDSETELRYFVMLHGANVNGQEARGWQSETFKRLYWSGLRARFVGVSWYGFEGSSANYHTNVVHAFDTAPFFGPRLKTVVGDAPVKIMAHSLGNMVVSSYLNDYYEQAPLNLTDYLLFNAAVALEAYLGDYQGYAEGILNDPFSPQIFGSDNTMVHSSWHGYGKRLGSSEWHQLFSKGDPRRTLTWRSRFANLPDSINYFSFYSTGEEVLATYAGESPSVEWPDVWNSDLGRNSWVLQEKWKGRSNPVGSTDDMGWGFNLEDYTLWSKDMANALVDESLRRKPFFRKPQPGQLGYELLGETADGTYVENYRNQLLARALPALTLPTGGWNGVNMNYKNFILEEKLFDMNALENRNGWPIERTQSNNFDLLHNDIRKVSHLYLLNIFDKLTDQLE
jgi:transglutaminase-like putative cysteine protease